MNDRNSWRDSSHHPESWRSNDIPLPPPERQVIPSLMDPPEVTELRRNIENLRQKISDSENNLQLHRNGMDALLDAHWRPAIRLAENQKVDRILESTNLNREELNAFFDQMGSSRCSKELMAQAKKWIFENCTTDQLREVILTYLLNKVKDESTGEYLRLHILYLINDWLFHCKRKKEDNQLKMLARYVPKMYAYGIELTSSSDMKDKMENKLLGEWEGRNYFPETVVKQLRNTLHIVHSDREIESSSYLSVKESIRSNLLATFEGYEQQHITFSQHIRGQIDEMERKIEELRNGPPAHSHMPPHMGPPQNMRRSRFDQAPSADRFAPIQQDTWRPLECGPPPSADDDIDGIPFNEETLKPQKSYMALPAGIMMPLVPMNSFTYESLNPDELEMPPVVPPSQRLLAAKNRFYKGIEMDMLAVDGSLNDNNELLKYPTEFLDKKARLKKEFLEDQRVSLDDIITNKPSKTDREMLDRERKLKEADQIAKYRASVDAYYGTQTPPPEPEEQLKRQSASRSPSRERHERRGSRSSSRSPSRSPRRRRRSRSRSRRSSSSSSTSSSTSSSSSKSTRSMDRERDRHGSRGFRAPSSDRPAFGFKSSHEPLPADNKGAQLMAKMGWTSGKGLGSSESGIVNPVSGGEVRDRNEQFMGFGRTLDPYEQFRKQRSGSYYDRGVFHRK